MDRYYLIDAIKRIELEREAHDEKFAANEVHKNCLPRFDSVIEKLKLELAKLSEISPGPAAGSSNNA
jgi:GTP1/Obg family GTP-binding protein